MASDPLDEWLDSVEALAGSCAMRHAQRRDTRRLVAFAREVQALCDHFDALPYPEHPDSYHEGMEDGTARAFAAVRGALAKLTEEGP